MGERKMTIKLNNQTEIDLTVLLETKLLIQANSGGGKSWAIRRLLEQSHGKVQQIVIDLEGEFSTLREKYDYILAGKGGDTPAEPRSAGLLAKRLLELNVSAIIDLYELDHYARKQFVKNFLEAMIDAPKELWHPVLVVIDEAHVFCPEKGQSEASSAVIELATRGRKRGYCAVLATQRLSKLNKDAAAECNNKLIGRTGLDIDRKRASEELGFTSKDQELSLRTLDAGEFYAFGTAISNEVIKVKIGDVQTTHPKAGSRILTAPPIPPTSKIREALGKLADLPQEAAEEAKTVDELRKQVFELTRQLRSQPKSEAKIDQKQIEEIRRQAEKMVRDNKVEADKTIKGLQAIISHIQNYLKLALEKTELEIKYPMYVVKIDKDEDFNSPGKFIPIEKADIDPVHPGAYDVEALTPLPLAPRKIYSFLFANPNREFSKTQLAAITGYAPKAGGFNNAMYRLNSLGLVKNNGGKISIGLVQPTFATEKQEEFNLDLWLSKLAKAPKSILEILLKNPNQEFSQEELGEYTGYTPGTGGFNNALYKLNSLGLIKRNNGIIKLNEELLEI